ncbi:hypothetical protein HW932_01900 [Allochromatium humboldtianum]|uniref:Uncharacterized protein n=1 Tax=Allochromatium humboldtianum TaxID=504901 RepID=A0A850R9Q5_9GAMM|nr:hypothetical protein [Allochromatium humboldtianum]NVZ08012.1 hypothetical protein [Allochromatium humboldtianum]
MSENLYVGGDPIEEDDLSTLDRGDTLEPSTEPEAPAPNAEPEAPEEVPSAESEAPEPSAETQAPEEAPTGEAAVPEGLKPDHKIPKARFDEVNLKRKAAEARLQQLEEELARLKNPASAESFDFDAKEEEYMAAVVDGEFAKAKAIRAEIRRAEQEALRAEAAKVKTEAVTQTQIELDFKNTVVELEAKYPAFNSRAETFDEDATNEVLELHNAYMQMGKYPTPSDSLRAAAELIALKYGVVVPQAPSPTTEPPAAPSKPVADAKKKAAIAAAQPSIPQSGAPGIPSGPSIRTMSEEEFDALPESKKAELRGDLV